VRGNSVSGPGAAITVVHTAAARANGGKARGIERGGLARRGVTAPRCGRALASSAPAASGGELRRCGVAGRWGRRAGDGRGPRARPSSAPAAGRAGGGRTQPAGRGSRTRRSAAAGRTAAGCSRWRELGDRRPAARLDGDRDLGPASARMERQLRQLGRRHGRGPSVRQDSCATEERGPNRRVRRPWLRVASTCEGPYQGL
jgi:hypothetical protein